MAPKRLAVKTDPNPSPTKAARTGSEPASAAAVAHPTILKLKEGLSTAEVKAFLSKVKPAKSFAGIDCFDLAAYKCAMKQSREYTCTMAATDIDVLKTTHAHLTPALGSLQFLP
jgi:hypothetical protein